VIRRKTVRSIDRRRMRSSYALSVTSSYDNDSLLGCTSVLLDSLACVLYVYVEDRTRVTNRIVYTTISYFDC